MNDYENLLKICEARKSCRAFDKEPVSADLIEKIRTAALTSPYASGRKNWRIPVMADGELLRKSAEVVERRVRELREKVRPDMQDAFASYARNFSFFSSAPVVFAPIFRVAPSLSLMVPADPGLLQFERDNYLKSISCVAMLILLAAESVGLGGCYVTGALIAEKELGDLIGIPPGWSIGALIPVGHKRE